MAWQPNPGNPAAQQFIAQYPDPRFLRDAIDRQGWQIITVEIQALPWSPDRTIGQVMRSEDGFSRQDILHLHTMVKEAAMDRQQWTSPDGTITIN